MPDTSCDLLCVGPHTDDAEIALGGTLARLASQGRSVWICDLTRGELASNADPDERWAEARRATEALGIAGRVQLELPDGFLAAADRDQAVALVRVIRTLRPRWIATVPEPRRHPDHLATPPLVERAAFLARLVALEAGPTPGRWWPEPPPQEPAPAWIVQTVCHTCRPDERPDLLLDVSASWSAKCAALACYTSQFRRDPGRRETHINHPDFLAAITDRARQWGRRAGVEYAEALVTAAVPVCDDLPRERWR
jgi:bacillithiol biosynthesis deacetylase BshB1